MDEKKTFEIGALVRLKSGSPMMTVWGHKDVDRVTCCVFWCTQNLKFTEFNAITETLELDEGKKPSVSAA